MACQLHLKLIDLKQLFSGWKALPFLHIYLYAPLHHRHCPGWLCRLEVSPDGQLGIVRVCRVIKASTLEEKWTLGPGGCFNSSRPAFEGIKKLHVSDSAFATHWSYLPSVAFDSRFRCFISIYFMRYLPSLFSATRLAANIPLLKISSIWSMKFLSSIYWRIIVCTSYFRIEAIQSAASVCCFAHQFPLWETDALSQVLGSDQLNAKAKRSLTQLESDQTLLVQRLIHSVH